MERHLKSEVSFTFFGENKDEIVSVVISDKEQEMAILKTNKDGISYNRYELRSMEAINEMDSNYL